MRLLTPAPDTATAPAPGPAEDLVLEVVLTDAAHVPHASAVLAPLLAGGLAAHGDVLELAVRGRDGTIVRAVQLLHRAGLGARDLHLRRPDAARSAA